MDDFVIKRNTPIARLIKDFRNKRSKKVVESRKEIQRRFAYLDWRDQKQILTAFLDSCKTDWQWACGKLLYYWDDSFLLKVQSLWEFTHDVKCSWTVIRHLPLDYIVDHLKELSFGRNYFFICKRFASEGKTIPVDKARFSSHLDYLTALWLMEQSITEEEATDTLYELIRTICINPITTLRQESIPYHPRYLVPGALSFNQVIDAIDTLMKMEQFQVVTLFHEWNDTICEAITHSPYYAAIREGHLDKEERLTIARRVCYNALPAKYKVSSPANFEDLLLPQVTYCIAPIDPTILEGPVDKDTYEELKNECSSLEHLIDELDLAPFPAIDDSPDPPPF